MCKRTLRSRLTFLLLIAGMSFTSCKREEKEKQRHSDLKPWGAHLFSWTTFRYFDKDKPPIVYRFVSKFPRAFGWKLIKMEFDINGDWIVDTEFSFDGKELSVFKSLPSDKKYMRKLISKEQWEKYESFKVRSNHSHYMISDAFPPDIRNWYLFNNRVYLDYLKKVGAMAGDPPKSDE